MVPRLEQTVVRLMSELSLGDDWVGQQARELAALPLGWDFWAHWFLRPNGEVVVTDGEVMEVSTERIKILSALVMGGKNYPELHALLPDREPDAPNCCHCLGSGRILERLICAGCGGVGWVPADEEAPVGVESAVG